MSTHTVITHLSAALLLGCAGAIESSGNSLSPQEITFILVPPSVDMTPNEDTWYDEFRFAIMRRADAEGLTIIDYLPYLDQWRSLGIGNFHSPQSVRLIGEMVGAEAVLRLEKITTPFTGGPIDRELTVLVQVIATADGAVLFRDRVSSNDSPFKQVNPNRARIVSLGLAEGASLHRSSRMETREEALSRAICSRLASL